MKRAGTQSWVGSSGEGRLRTGDTDFLHGLMAIGQERMAKTEWGDLGETLGKNYLLSLVWHWQCWPELWVPHPRGCSG